MATSLVKSHDLPFSVWTYADHTHPLNEEFMNGVREGFGDVEGPCGWWTIEGETILTQENSGSMIQYVYPSDADAKIVHQHMLMLTERWDGE